MLKYTRKPKNRGSSITVCIDVDRDGQPFAQIWTFRSTRTTWHPIHVKLAATGEHRTFWNVTETGGDLAAAKAWLEEVACPMITQTYEPLRPLDAPEDGGRCHAAPTILDGSWRVYYGESHWPSRCYWIIPNSGVAR